jgi:hypothetical protein
MADEKTRSERGPGAPPAGTIVFTCGNGHRLTVPVTLGGRRGKCSKCGIPVQIPAADDAAAAELADPPPTEVMPRDETPGESAAAGVAEPPPGVDMFAGLGEVAAGQGEPAYVEAPHRPPAAEPEWGPPPDIGNSNPTAVLAARLWEERRHGGIIELHISGGSVILPEWFEPRWSGGTHGLFASRAADGTVTLTAVAWEAIQKIVVRQVEGLPDGMFE